jgi:hypothetical protein
VISGALLYIPDDIPLSPLQQGFVVSGLSEPAPVP